MVDVWRDSSWKHQEKLPAAPAPGRFDCFEERSQLFGTTLSQRCLDEAAGRAAAAVHAGVGSTPSLY